MYLSSTALSKTYSYQHTVETTLCLFMTLIEKFNNSPTFELLVSANFGLYQFQGLVPKILAIQPVFNCSNSTMEPLKH